MNVIDLPAEQAGKECECCREEAATLVDRELGPVCDDCFEHSLRAMRLMRREVAR